MPNAELFSTTSPDAARRSAPDTTKVNEAGGAAYAMGDPEALAQLAVTGTFHGTFYADAAAQLEQMKSLAERVHPTFLAKLAIYARDHGNMKDTPAALLAVLQRRAPELVPHVFPRVCDSAKMMRNYVQMIRSGAFGRKSLGSRPKRMVQEWLTKRAPSDLFRQSVGTSPSLADVVKMVHPKPPTPEHAAFFAWLIGKPCDVTKLPENLLSYEGLRERGEGEVSPGIPFEMLISLNLGPVMWKEIARRASWTQTRMNLNTFARHGVFEDPEIVTLCAKRLADPELVAKAKVFPYQLLTAYQATTDVPMPLRLALQDALEHATKNVPTLEGQQIYVFPDVSGSMGSPVTGHRAGGTTATRCIDVAALVAAALVRANPSARVLPFESTVTPSHLFELNPRDSVMTNAAKLSNLPCGGTNCAAPLELLNREKAKGDICVYVSDNESWINSGRHGAFGGSATGTMRAWNEFRARNRNAKLVCIDIQPYTTTQALDRADILNIGGFSDNVFATIAAFARGQTEGASLVREVNAITF